MFIPRTRPVHRDLPTSFVLVDALVDYLCEGGFSGIIELILHRGGCFVVIDKGTVSAAVLGSGKGSSTPATVSEIASMARAERGRVSVYECSSRASEVLTGRLAAEPLYERLSTDFADLDRMISKLGREKDREWYIEISTVSGATGLVHLSEDGAAGISSNEVAPEGDAARQYLLEECKKAGGSFDVYFRTPGAAVPLLIEIPGATLESPPSSVPSTPPPASVALTQPTIPLVLESSLESGNGSGDSDPLGLAMSAMDDDVQPPSGIRPPEPVEFAVAAPVQKPKPRVSRTGTLTQEEKTANRMAEIKQTVGTILSTIESAALSLEARDTFSIYLRAGQLKIADRYPFLDPFGSEFEYHAGEVVFVGKATPENFISGLTEAIKLAVISVIETSSQPARLRAKMIEDLNALATLIRPELYKLGLNDMIEDLLAGITIVQD